MELKELQEKSFGDSQGWFPELHDRGPEQLQLHYALGLGGETGELLNLIKKANRGQTVLKNDVAMEMADVLTYLADLAELMGIDLSMAWAMKRRINAERFG